MPGIEQTITAALKDQKLKGKTTVKGKASEQNDGLAAQKKIKTVLDQRDTIKKNRLVFERQWLVNLAFLFGRQYFTIEKKPVSGLDERIYWELKNMERKKKTRRVSNYILPLFRSLLSKMMLMKSTVTVDATTNSERDRAAAKISQEVSEDFWQNCNKHNPLLCQNSPGMMLVLKQLFTYILTMGNGFLKPYFNPETKSKAFMDNKVLPGVEIGEVEVEVLHNFDIFTDPMGRWTIQQKIMDVDRIKEVYGKKVEPEDPRIEDYASRLINMMEGAYEVVYDNAAKVYEKYELPNSKNKNGKLTVLTKKKIIYERDLPPEYKGRMPYIKFDYLDLMLNIVPYAQGMIEQLISLQEEYNYTITRLAGYKKWMAGKVMIPRKSKISSKWDDEVGQLLFYNSGFGKPEYQTPPSPPSFLGDEIIRIRRDMEDIAGVHDTSLGRIPTQAKSGVAIENLAELDTSQMAPQLITLEQKLSFFMEMVLEIMEDKYSEGRFMELTGDLYNQEVKSFIGSDLAGNRRLKVSLGSSMPSNKAARQNFILEIEKRGFITKDKARELLEFGDVEGIYHSLDETLAKEENQNMANDSFEVIVEPWEDHAIHLKNHTDFMKTKDWFELPDEIKDKFREHIKQHQTYLLAEAQAVSAGGGGSMPAGAAPGPAAPAGGGQQV